MMIDIVRYPKTKVAKPVSASKFVPNLGLQNEDSKLTPSDVPVSALMML